ncbi:MAG: hypothetical protein CBD33_02955 [Euryarchaeota archaeon TMED173]|nr:MAG: hypothetical protein CBD33_02955 [Euryarchaeota archaeon TMED173]
MRTTNTAVLLTALLLASFVSLPVSAAASISLSSDSMAKSATTDDPAEYTITILNDGDEDLTVTLSTSQAADCNGFTSNLDSSVANVGQGESESVTLTVSINDQASGECETTVNANGVGTNPSDNAQDDITVTTTAEGGGQYSVKLSYKVPNNGQVTYDGDGDEVEWTVDVENTGENQATVQLSIASSSQCDSNGLDATVDPQQMNLDSEDSEEATISVTLEDGSSTESGDHCFVLEASVSNDPNTIDQANDSIELDLRIPEVKTCDSELQKPSHTLDPGESESNSFTTTNTGNTGWTVQVMAMADGVDVSDWFSFSPNNALLQKPNEQGDTASFNFDINPDDTVEPGTVDVYIQGRAGSSIGCQTLLRINLGQVHDAAITLSSSTLNNVDPGSSATTSLMVTNTGNGQDNFAIGNRQLSPGWQVEFSETYITIDGKHCTTSSNCDRRSVEMQVSAPENARAGVEYPIIFYVNSQGSTLDEITLKVTVSPIHGGKISVPSDSQTGRFGQWVSFPLSITNTGNIQDSFALASCDPDISDSCEETKWDSRFKDSEGNEIAQLIIQPEETATVSMEVLVSDNINNNSEDFEGRVGIIGTDTILTRMVTVTVSNFNYSIAVAFESPEEDPSQMIVALPPGGSSSLSFILSNTGDGGADEAVVSVSGMDSSVVRIISVDGQVVDGSAIPIPANGQINVQIDFDVLEVDSGTSGIIKVGVTSKKNTGQAASFLDLVVDIRAIHDLGVTIESETSKKTAYPENTEFQIFVTNNGNIEEEIEVLTSDSLRGWSVDVISDEFKLQPGNTREVTVRVTPPSDMISDDEYSFTVIVQPKGLPVAGEPLDLSVESTLASGSLSTESQQMIAIGIIILGALSILLLFMRNRTQNRIMSEDVYLELDD